MRPVNSKANPYGCFSEGEYGAIVDFVSAKVGLDGRFFANDIKAFKNEYNLKFSSQHSLQGISEIVRRVFKALNETEISGNSFNVKSSPKVCPRYTKAQEIFLSRIVLSFGRKLTSEEIRETQEKFNAAFSTNRTPDGIRCKVKRILEKNSKVTTSETEEEDEADRKSFQLLPAVCLPIADSGSETEEDF